MQQTVPPKPLKRRSLCTGHGTQHAKLPDAIISENRLKNLSSKAKVHLRAIILTNEQQLLPTPLYSCNNNIKATGKQTV